MTQRRTQPVRRSSAPAQRNASGYRNAPTRRPKPGRLDWLKRQLRKRPLPVWVVVTIDVLVFGVALCTFALFHHVIPRNVEAVGISSSRDSMAAQSVATAQVQPESSVLPETTELPAATEMPEPTATPDPVGYFGTKYADKFTSGEVNQDAWHYQSANLNISNSTMEYCGTDVYVSDIYVRDISSFATAFAKDRYGRNFSEDVKAQFAVFRDEENRIHLKTAVYENGKLEFEEEITETVHDVDKICGLLRECGFEVIKCDHQLLDDAKTQVATWYVVAKKL